MNIGIWEGNTVHPIASIAFSLLFWRCVWWCVVSWGGNDGGTVTERRCGDRGVRGHRLG